MSLNHLIPCPQCARHVRASESHCPFCAGSLPDAVRAVVPSRKPTGRLTRAALYTFSATSLTLATACSSTPSAEPLYGCPPDACGIPADGAPSDSRAHDGANGNDAPEDVGTGPDATGDDGGGPDGIVAAYGAPADAFPTDTQEGDAGDSDADTGAVAAYGSPAHDL